MREAAIVLHMAFDATELPNDIAVLKALLIVANKRTKDLDAEVETLKLTIAKLQHNRFGASSKVRNVPARRPLSANLPRERVIVPSPSTCSCCGGGNLRKLGEDVTETLERVPATWKIVQHVREKFSCRSCEKVTQPPAPSHPIARGRAGPVLLAEVLFIKYGAHLPLNRQSQIFAREGVPLDVSTMADWVGAAAATLMPLRDAIEKHAHAAERRGSSLATRAANSSLNPGSE